MKKSIIFFLVTILVFGVWSTAFADETNSETAIKKATVDVTVKVAEWATISELNPMSLDLGEPGRHYRTSQSITIKTNTGITVSVSEPEPDEGSSILSEAIEGEAFNWGLGFSGGEFTSLYPSSSFNLDAGEIATKDLVFWAELKEGNWWKLPADNYKGKAVVTLYAN
ncbi:MAG: hypothetical protein GX969_02590 [Firmicutes bacterium]|nr:hypothetical protein [Bacillota bacterium]